MSIITGYSKSEMINHSLFEFVDKENKKVLQQQLNSRSKGGSISYEIEWIKKDSNKMATLVSPRPIFNEHGKYIGSYALIRDITDEKKIEEERLKTQKLESLSVLTGGISHISGLCEYLEKIVSIPVYTIRDIDKVVDYGGTEEPLEQYINAFGALIRL